MNETDSDHAGYCLAEVRRHDHDRYLAALLAPAERQTDIIGLLAFNLEVAKTAEVVSEPMMGQIRLQWWREAIDEAFAGRPRHHAVLEVLAPTIGRHALSREHFDRLIDAREFDLEDEPPEDMTALEAYAEDSSATLLWLMLEILGEESAEAREAARHAGIAWGLVGMMRALPFHIGRRRLNLPRAVMSQVGIDPTDLHDRRQTEHLPDAVRLVSGRAEEHLGEARQLARGVPRTALPALMVVPLTAHYLKSLARAGHDPASPVVQRADKLNAWRLAWAKLRGRL
ncbi:MAG: phytoene/squalene synthase family protein [Rhodovibrionaceae bacterium]|nr:phytoene/squalene synthase family protein [Rhodovibrionaceae bacterium]